MSACTTRRWATAIFPTPVMGIVGLLKTAAPIPLAFQNEGRAVVLLGGIGTASHERFGGTQYAKVVMDAMWGLPPALDMDYEKRVHDAMREIAAEGLAESAHDVSDGGLAVALAEASFGPAGIGARVDLKSDLAPQYLLFHEGPSRILVSTANAERVRQIGSEHGVEAIVLGDTMKDGVTNQPELRGSGAVRRLHACESGSKPRWQQTLS